jgi:hypothetical protein
MKQNSNRKQPISQSKKRFGIQDDSSDEEEDQENVVQERGPNTNRQNRDKQLYSKKHNQSNSSS